MHFYTSRQARFISARRLQASDMKAGERRLLRPTGSIDELVGNIGASGALPPMMAGPDKDKTETPDLGLATKTRSKTKKPQLYKVLMLNDDYTPMEFVVLVLQRFFRMDIEEATRVMLQVHQKGVGVCGVFSYEVAETKVNQVMDCARTNQHPLQCTLEVA